MFLFAIRLMNAKQQRKESAIAHLRTILKPGDTIQTVLVHVSRSGMYRHIKIVYNGNDISGYVAAALEYKWISSGAVGVGGCGMDMGFHIINSLSYALFHEYKCTGKGCQSAAHVNSPRKPYRKGINHKDGYALKQRWL